MITTTYTANALVAQRQAELRATGRSIRVAKEARAARRALVPQSTSSSSSTSSAGWSLPTLAQRINLSARRRFALI